MSVFTLFKPSIKTSIPQDQQRHVLRVVIRNREKVIFDGDAIALSSMNSEGPFDVLAQHINFISIIREHITIYKPDKTKQEYNLRIGLMKVTGNKIEIYVGIAPQIPSPQSAKK
jgi:F0F1-type ATP synthase epsilon subunit